jgi:hypothetical protein
MRKLPFLALAKKWVEKGEATGGNIPPQQQTMCKKICDDTV